MTTARCESGCAVALATAITFSLMATRALGPVAHSLRAVLALSPPTQPTTTEVPRWNST